MKKLLNKKGETIGETLVSLLIVCLSIAMLCGGIVSAARINAKIDISGRVFNISEATSKEVTVTAKTGSQSVVSSTVTQYETENGYFYYEP